MEPAWDFIDACRKFIEIDSSPGIGTVEIANYAAELCRQSGLAVEIQSESFNGIDQANVIARPRASRPEDELLLQTHLDTCDPGNYALWTKTGANPFNASIYQDTLFGLGCASAKLDFLCKLRAVSAFKSRDWKLPYVLVGTFGEEIGMQGAVKLVRKKQIASRAALVGGPTDLQLVCATKGFAAVEIEIPFSDEEKEFRAQHDLGQGTTTQSRVFIGKSAHSSLPQLGDSAILKMLDYLAKLPHGISIMEIEGGTSANTIPAHAVLEIDAVGTMKDSMAAKITRIAEAVREVERQFAQFIDKEFDPPQTTVNIGMIRTVQDYVKLSGSCRLPPTVTDETYERWMSVLRQACESVGAVFRISNYKPPFRTPLDAPLIRSCQEELRAMGRPIDCVTQSWASEANVFNRLGMACVVVGPGRGVGNSHAPNEHVKIEDLTSAVRFYTGVVERVCL